MSDIYYQSKLLKTKQTQNTKFVKKTNGKQSKCLFLCLYIKLIVSYYFLFYFEIISNDIRPRSMETIKFKTR